MSTVEISQENFDYLARQLALSGFSDIKQQELERKMLKDREEFTIEHSVMIGKDKVDITLNFAKGQNRPELSDKEYYFFNSFDMQLQKEGKEEVLTQKFGMYYGNSFTLHEAYNLMDGRSVNKNFISKDNEKYNAWAYIDFKKTTDDGNYQMKRVFSYDLGEHLQKLPIKNIDNLFTQRNLMDGLKRGDVQMVNFVYGDKEEKRHIEAAPRYNSINIYDENMKRQYLANENDKRQVTEQQAMPGQEQAVGPEINAPTAENKAVDPVADGSAIKGKEQIDEKVQQNGPGDQKPNDNATANDAKHIEKKQDEVQLKQDSGAKEVKAEKKAEAQKPEAKKVQQSKKNNRSRGKRVG